MTKLITKVLVQQFLDNNSNRWLLIEEISAFIPTAPRSTVARALRKLREQNVAISRPAAHSGRFSEWATASASVTTSPQPSSLYQHYASQVSQNNQPNAGSGSSAMPTLQAAIEGLVAEFVGNQKTFSAHDITTELRARSNNGSVVIDKAETGIVHAGAASAEVPRIEHDKVKEIVTALYQNGMMGSYDRTNNGSFWQYAPGTSTSGSGSGSGSGGTSNGSSTDGDGNGTSGTTYDGTSSLS